PGEIAALTAHVGPTTPGSSPEASEAQRRVALADWITAPGNPLFSRVMVNRLWQWHFGVGIVDTPSDFGFNGGRPTHPDLLDWLAREFQARGMSIKSMHRLLVTSTAYRQASRPVSEAMGKDADNRLLWRKSPQRLEAESIRDAVLTATGKLDRRMGGPSYLDFKTYFFKGTQFYDPLQQVGPEFHRRSLYRMGARGGRNPFLEAFDCPDPSASTPRRAVTTTPLQALALLNNAFVLDQAKELARQVRDEAGDDPGLQIHRAYQRIYGRDPEPEERATLQPFVRRHGLEALARVLFNSNEYIQIE
ncbi:MAG: DUF1553 domain-containing protein, partial [Gemmataceae bacterium]